MKRWAAFFSTLVLIAFVAGFAPAANAVVHSEDSEVHANISPEAAQDVVEPVEEELEEDIGFPQLKTASYPMQVFWLFVSFVLLYTLMSRMALPRVTEVLETRRSMREGNLEKAGALNEEAEKIRSAYEKSLAQAQKKAGDAQRAAERAAAEKMAAEQARFADQSRKRLSATEQSINKAKAEALHSLADIAADIAADMALKVADVQVSKADAKKAVMTAMQEG